MSKRIGHWCVVLAMVSGCGSSSAPTPPAGNGAASSLAPAPAKPSVAPVDPGAVQHVDPGSAASYLDDQGLERRVVASIDVGKGLQRHVTMGQLIKPLIEAHGLNTLLLLVQLEQTKQFAEDRRVTISADELRAEREATLGKMFEQADDDNDKKIEEAQKEKNEAKIQAAIKRKQEERDDLLRKFLEQQRMSEAELEVVLETNAYLRKLAEPEVKAQITEEVLRQRFKLRYNEQAKCRHIQLARPADAVAAKKRLAAGESFEKVAREMSTNKPTAVLDGELPPFTRLDERIPANFREAAFAMKEGGISEIIETGDAYQIIKLEKLIAPRVVKFEDVRDSLYKELLEETVTKVMGRIRFDIGAKVRDALRISDPILAKQFQEKKDAFEKADKIEREKIIEAERRRTSATQPYTGLREKLAPEGSGPAPVFGPAPSTVPASTQPAPGVGKATAPAPATRPAGAATRPAGGLK